MAQTDEKIQIDYAHKKTYDLNPQNQVGTDADFKLLYPNDAPLREVPTPSGDIAYVRKFGTPFKITDLIDIADPGAARLQLVVKTADGTTQYGVSPIGGGAYVDGDTTNSPQAIRIDASAHGGTAILPATITITDATFGALTIALPTETIPQGGIVTFYIGSGGSSYYDIDLKYGGARHTPILGNTLKSYFTKATAYAALVSSNNDAVCVLDSKTYDEELILDKADVIIYANTGQSPIHTRGIGARITREVSTVHNNINAIFWNENGSDANDGTWQNPKLTAAGAQTDIVSGTHNLIYGGIGATVLGGVSTEIITTVKNFDIEPEYGYTPTIIGYITCSAGLTNNVYGMTIDVNYGTTNGIGVVLTNVATIQDNTVKNIGGALLTPGIRSVSGCIIKNNLVFDCQVGITSYSSSSGIITVEKNIVYNCGRGIDHTSDGGTDTSIIRNNIAYNSTRGISITVFGTTTFNGIVTNNTLTLNDYGMYFEIEGTFSELPQNNISHNNTIYDMFKSGAGADPQVIYSNYVTFSNVLNGGGNVGTDPGFSSVVSPFRFGISPSSAAHCSTNTKEDMGAILSIITLAANDIIINGICMNGNSQYNNAIRKQTTTTYTGLEVRNCKAIGCNGVVVDIYDDNTDLDAIIENNLMYNNGSGLSLLFGNNVINNNVVYSSYNYGSYSDGFKNIYTNNVFYDNKYGIWLLINSLSNSITDCIVSGNVSYGIYSEVNVVVTFSCVDDSINNIVDATSITNIFSSPLFNDVSIIPNDLRVKRNERGTVVNSPCIGASSTEGDIGTYNEQPTILTDSWKRFLMIWNPTTLNEGSDQKDISASSDTFGNLISYMADDKIQFPFVWDVTNVTTKEQRLKIKHFQNRIPSEKNNLTESECEFRVHLVPTTLFGTGEGVVDATAKTITNNSANYVEDEKKGWHVGLKYDKSNSAGSNLFYAGMESNLLEWTSTTTAGSGAVARTTPGLDGTVGALNCLTTGSASDRAYGLATINLTKDSFMVSFYTDISDMAMSDGQIFDLFDTSPTNYFRLIHYRNGTDFALRIGLTNDSSVFITGNKVIYDKTIPHLVQLIMKRPSASLSLDGSVSLFIDGALSDTLDSYDNYNNYMSISSPKFGAADNVGTGTTGNLDIDEVYIIQGDAMLIDATNKILMVSSVTWTIDEWVGYYIKINGYYYIIKSNTANQLTLADSNNTLKNEVLTEWAIEKYFKVLTNDESIIEVVDDDSELLDGTLDYYFDFVLMKVIPNNFATSQIYFDFLNDDNKAGYGITWEEID